MSEKPVGRPRSIDTEKVSLLALDLFDRDGFDRVSMDDVAAAVNISRRSLFRLFPTKAALVSRGLDECADRLRASLETAQPDAPTLATVEVACRAAGSIPSAALAVTRRRMRVIAVNPGLADEAGKHMRSLTEPIEAFIRSREERASEGFHASVVAHLLAAATAAALSWWATHDEKKPECVVAEAVAIALRKLE